MGTPPRHSIPLTSLTRDSSSSHHQAAQSSASSPAPKSDSQDEMLMILDKVRSLLVSENIVLPCIISIYSVRCLQTECIVRLLLYVD